MTNRDVQIENRVWDTIDGLQQDLQMDFDVTNEEFTKLIGLVFDQLITDTPPTTITNDYLKFMDVLNQITTGKLTLKDVTNG